MHTEPAPFWHNYFPTLEDIALYPVIRYRGCRVWPEVWHPDAVEPLVRCRLETHDLNPASEFGRHTGSGILPYDEFAARVTADGWQWDMREGGTKYIHVDDLEKIEGPPPAGPF
jgi:hypothetical protein